MKSTHINVLTAALVMAGVFSTQAVAGNGAPSGAHYNLNILGVDKGKNSDMTGSDRHTIFVKLGSTGAPEKSNIYLTPAPANADPNDDFTVCDGNATATDTGAYDCSGTKIQNAGAVFQLPCNTNLPATDPNDPNYTLYGCDGEYALAYEVWVRALGTPGGTATMTTCADEVVDVNGSGTLTHICSTENVVLVRNATKPTFKNVTNELTSLCVNLNDGDANTCDARYALFRNELEDWVWEYDNQGLKLAQLRFYKL